MPQVEHTGAVTLGNHTVSVATGSQEGPPARGPILTQLRVLARNTLEGALEA